MIRFSSFRINLVEPHSIQTSLFDKEKREKKELVFKKAIEDLLIEKKSSFIYRGIKYFMFFIKKSNENIYYIELAKEEYYQKPIEGASSIEQITDKRTPYIYLVLDFTRQILLIQDKTSVFTNVDIPKIKIETFFSGHMSEKQISFFLKPITNKNQFWDEIDSFEQINEFDLTLNGPNLFEGRFKATELVKQVYDDYNISEFKIVLKNKLGQLKLLKENLEDYISLAAAGAGKYIVKAFKNGKKVKLTSDDKIETLSYNIEKIDEVDLNKLDKDLGDLDTKNDDIKNS